MNKQKHTQLMKDLECKALANNPSQATQAKELRAVVATCYKDNDQYARIWYGQPRKDQEWTRQSKNIH